MPALTSLPYPTPVSGASLLLAFKPKGNTILIIGQCPVAASRAFVALESGANVVVAGYNGVDAACDEIQYRVGAGQVGWIDLPPYSIGEWKKWEEEIAQVIFSTSNLVLVCVTDTLLGGTTSHSFQASRIGSSKDKTMPRQNRLEAASSIARLCRAQRIPINVTDVPLLCDFTFPATHRFNFTLPNDGGGPSSSASPPMPSSLQISITTNGKACRLASRIRREIIASLPKNIGLAVENIETLRAATIEETNQGETTLLSSVEATATAEEGPVSACRAHVNAPVKQGISKTEEPREKMERKMRWIAQISEYWPLDRLSTMNKDEIGTLLKDRHQVASVCASSQSERNDEAQKSCPRRRAPPQTHSLSTVGSGGTSRSSTLPISDTLSHSSPPSSNAQQGTTPIELDLGPSPSVASRHSLIVEPPTKSQGRILLVGSGPGHPSLLTVAARKALLEIGTLILSDKLVPSQVLDLIPKSKAIYIAKKYPGNAEGAQNELMEMAVEGARRGEVVVRLKQGDPFLYGRGGEEVLYFRSHGFEPLVIPGVSSALAGPLLAGIPVTQRGVAESLVVCTGVGRQGKEVELPGYQREKSVCILMGVARLSQIVQALTSEESTRRNGRAYPLCTPIAIIERASCPDQRVISSTLRDIEQAIERCGEQRPPAMIFVGWAALALSGSGNLEVLDDSIGVDDNDEGLLLKDHARVERWLGAEPFAIQEGLLDAWHLV